MAANEGGGPPGFSLGGLARTSRVTSPRARASASGWPTILRQHASRYTVEITVLNKMQAAAGNDGNDIAGLGVHVRVCGGGSGAQGAHWTTLSLESAHGGSSSGGRILMWLPLTSRMSFICVPLLQS